jgi:hypothetical protein
VYIAGPSIGFLRISGLQWTYEHFCTKFTSPRFTNEHTSLKLNRWFKMQELNTDANWCRFKHLLTDFFSETVKNICKAVDNHRMFDKTIVLLQYPYIIFVVCMTFVPVTDQFWNQLLDITVIIAFQVSGRYQSLHVGNCWNWSVCGSFCSWCCSVSSALKMNSRLICRSQFIVTVIPFSYFSEVSTQQVWALLVEVWRHPV